MRALIQTKDVNKVYRLAETPVYALSGVNFSLHKGEFAAIVGPSGSGKSTLMNILGCLDAPTTGSYRLDGIEVSAMNPSMLSQIRNRKIGFIFQQFNLLPRLSALENVALPLIYRGMGAQQRTQRSREALERVGLSKRLHHRPNELSGGQQQRVAIARALVTDTPLILADEPTGNLDSKSGLEILQMLCDLHESGRTILLITHDADVASRAKRRVTIEDGHIVRDDAQIPSEGREWA